MKNDESGSVQATKTSLAVLSALETLDGEATLAELSEIVSASKSTVYKHLSTLEGGGLVIVRGNTYYLGLRCLELGGIAQRYDGIYRVAKPEIESLAADTGELANLMVEENGYGFYMYTASGDQAVTLDTDLGKRIHLHKTAVGKALLSSLSDERVEEIVDSHGLPAETENTITHREELFEELAKIRSEGVAHENQERVDGTGCVGIPVETDDRRQAAISITAPIHRLTVSENHSDIVDRVKQAANVIEVNLAHQ